MSESRRVVITGMGAVTPLGMTLDEVWRRLLAGDSGVDYITHFDASGFPTKIAAEVCYDLGEVAKTCGEYAGRNGHFAMVAATQAIADSGIDVDKTVPDRIGIYLGSGEGAMDFFNFVNLVTGSWRDGEVDVGLFLKKGKEVLNGLREVEQKPFMPSAHIANRFNVRGPTSNCLTACAASSQAIGEATEIIRRGDADVMISGGTHSMIHPFGVAGFNLLTAISTSNDEPKKASRPFDIKRNGFILGEGSGMLILEELEHARKRGARVYAEIIGYGSTCDSFRVTDGHPEGRGAIAAIKGALDDAGLSGDEVDYINAHGTSTAVNDRVETLAIKNIFGERAYKIPVSSIKSMIGHLIAAAGAVELITCTLAIQNGAVPPTINYEFPDPDCDLDYVPNECREVDVRIALSNSFGFGGQNVSLLIRRFDG